MKTYAILDTNTTSSLIAAGKVEVLRDLFGTVHLPDEVRKELGRFSGTQDFAKHPPEWVQPSNPKTIDPILAEWMKPRGQEPPRIDAGEAHALSLAKELTADGSGWALVLSDDNQARKFINMTPEQPVFATGYWSVILQAADRGLIDLTKERRELEKHCVPGSSEKQRDHVLEMDSPDRQVSNTGFTPKEKIDLFEGYLKERNQEQDHGIER